MGQKGDIVPGFAAAVKRLREAKGWSQMRLAVAAGTHSQTVSNVEREERAPSLRIALALAAALDVTVDEMCRLVKSKKGG
jgi:transcriptional regulator with XRE-family HTH domain